MTIPNAARKPAEDQRPNLDELADLLRDVAAAEIMPRFRRTAFRDKDDGSLVTDADLAVQQRLGEALSAHWPGIPLLGEEMDADSRAQVLAAASTQPRGSGSDTPDDADGAAHTGSGSGPCTGSGSGPSTHGNADQTAFWCLDPLDGTSNFTCGFPGFGVSLALVRGGRTELGLVLDPLRDECFAASRGQGAWCNGEPIKPFAPGARLKDCIAVVDIKRLPADRVGHLLAPGPFRSQRNLGAVALEWCWLAAGRFQLYLHGGQHLWDYAAGELIAAEAGAATALLAADAAAPTQSLTLEKRVALAAATPSLMSLWQAFIRLPLRG